MSYKHLFALAAVAAVAAMLGFVPQAAVATPTPPSYCSPCLFYGGDFDPSDLKGEAIYNVISLGINQSAVYTPFVVPNGQTWQVSGLLTDDTGDITIDSAYWEIRSGVSAGNGGTLLFSGTDNSPVVTNTGINFFEFGDLLAVEVTGLNGISLGPGTYWLSVVPVCLDASNLLCLGASGQADTDGLNAFGPAEPSNDAFWNSSYFSQNFSLINSPYLDTTMSAGVIGTTSVHVPEPGVLGMFGLGVVLIGLFAGLRRRQTK